MCLFGFEVGKLLICKINLYDQIRSHKLTLEASQQYGVLQKDQEFTKSNIYDGNFRIKP